eukprot:6184431-Pleurochrysis_carterae.AAC.1
MEAVSESPGQRNTSRQVAILLDPLHKHAEFMRGGRRPPSLLTINTALIRTSRRLAACTQAPSQSLAVAEAWTMERGRPSVEVLAKHLPTAAEGVRVFWCGPPPFNDAVRQIVGELGFSDAQVHEFS